MIKRGLVALLFLATLANACSGLLTIAAQARFAPITAKTVYDGDWCKPDQTCRVCGELPDPANPAKHHDCMNVFRAQEVAQFTAVPAAACHDMACEWPAPPARPERPAAAAAIDEIRLITPQLMDLLKVPIA